MYSPQPLHVDDVTGFLSLHFLQTQVSPEFTRLGLTEEFPEKNYYLLEGDDFGIVNSDIAKISKTKIRKPPT